MILQFLHRIRSCGKHLSPFGNKQNRSDRKQTYSRKTPRRKHKDCPARRDKKKLLSSQGREQLSNN
jgi:hypothetical protein